MIQIRLDMLNEQGGLEKSNLYTFEKKQNALTTYDLVKKHLEDLWELYTLLKSVCYRKDKKE